MFKRELSYTSTLGRRFISQNPKFEPLGNPASLVNVSLPPSTVLNLRSNSILAANGDLNNLNSQLSVLKLLTKPLIYNQISSITPISIILSNKGSNKFFINLELNSNDEWKILNTKNLTAWYGQDLKILNDKFGIKIQSGNGSSNIILNGENQLFTLNLDSNETIYLNPKSIIAINSKSKDEIFTKLQSSTLSSISIPKFKIWDSIKINFNQFLNKLNRNLKTINNSSATSEIKATSQEELVSKPQLSTPATEQQLQQIGDEQTKTKFEIPQSIKSIGTWIYNKFNNIYLNDKIFYQVKGPATIIIQNSTSNKTSQIFTNDQLKEIYKNL
ncbi:hypothetical protein BN7_5408 [Wickerhamomyces ciferrii]|uniref:Altered inheritance of mitochondria protein 24, mitochondrial n=1 Tax=Wickerhamomyces ciferrii (strain ATCC 14091 / BCRC 22168 / CBS 111 / JCM 3599 / NBRC 0793 / NRRL Y-1031 F-60-10) TaxID=1206466 RepID=K0KV99_WICCF|nr:uncharacterized protein BN7_5408 [Wickerhamomyces ciferrii]CCH45822.1 hypothetical protein BN7_5408 [Wickerhamomyces ciferrii]